MEAEGQSQTVRCYTADLKVEEGGHEPLEAGKCEDTDSTLEFPEGTQPCRHPDCSPVRPRQTSNLRNVT